MSAHTRRGASAFDRLTTHYDVDLVCPKCGNEDAEGHWKAQTDGGTVRYTHLCPSCGEIRQRTLRLGSHQ
ncbi:HVO_0649 family zinc finger protein [Haloarchaeobius sp. DYHT-AS-18]|uniref:HVO_0649 family zinc finger protein n=1 Tax=Haloarchaeobius sp. DYHT-AS-18 TaxID=3446117 RepID=UPI003EB9BFB4